MTRSCTLSNFLTSTGKTVYSWCKCGQAVAGISSRNAGKQLSSREITTLKLSSLSLTCTEKENVGLYQLCKYRYTRYSDHISTVQDFVFLVGGGGSQIQDENTLVI